MVNHRYCCTVDIRVGENERKKVEKYQDLRTEIGRLQRLEMVEVVPVVSQNNLMCGLKSYG